ncbi:hypothetical protein OOT46_11985 [Aquabacterium sp. A7-Y]|uniref:hypothetical protein n=1 Tax=Aquabacterium sp. A7-Y TaxID=1349605 RepID=UPI00223CB754|nr:hypothetical protein [Aquabacterium sp. A7-Y]MCW7538562.1 hypothetical protein [Aquabacterium sp. A7-Y]
MQMLHCHPNQKACPVDMKGRPMPGPPLGLLRVAGHLRSSALDRYPRYGVMPFLQTLIPHDLLYNARPVFKDLRTVVHAARKAIASSW